MQGTTGRASISRQCSELLGHCLFNCYLVELLGHCSFNCRFSRGTGQNGVSRNFDIFTFLHENVQQCVHFDVMTLILLHDH